MYHLIFLRNIEYDLQNPKFYKITNRHHTIQNLLKLLKKISKNSYHEF